MTDYLQTIDVEFSADSVETCPLNPRILACGTYQLLPDEVDGAGERQNARQHRVGRVYFYEHAAEEGRLYVLIRD